MTRSLQIGELFVLGFSGATPPAWLRQFAAAHGLGGVILFDYDWQQERPQRNVIDRAQLTALCAELHALPTRPLIFVDQEGGRVCRLKPARGFAPLPSAEEFARLPETARRALARTSYGELRALGIDVNLAPVVDLRLNPDNPDIAALGRAFSADPAVVRDNVRLLGSIARELGLGLCLKHYPGLGGATTNTHKSLTDLSEVLDDAQLALFFELGAETFGGAVMVAHGFVRQWDATLPASISPAALGRLRARLPQAVIISDDLQMQALQQVLPTPAACRQGLRAGLDLLLIGNNLLPEERESLALVQGLAREVDADAGLQSLARAALERIRALKALLAR